MTESTLGLLAVFDTAEELERATRLAGRLGLTRFDPVSPYPLEHLFPETPHERRRRWPAALLFPHLNVVGVIALGGGLAGMVTGFGMQWLANSWSFPMNIGGKPHFSWPNFIPITFELAVLFSAGSVFLSLFLLLRLPEPYHPNFNSPSFDLSRDRFYLFVSREDPLFHRTDFLAALEHDFPAARVEEVAA
jgi:hypothetical protein